METTEIKLNARTLLSATFLILVSNLIYIGNNYIIAWTELQATEVALARGLLQVLVFGFVFWKEQKTKEKGKETSICVRTVCLLIVYGFSIATMSFACIAAIPMMPIGDLIVLCFTSPVFSLFLDRIIGKRFLTFLSVLLCFLILVGDILVVQPPFIFNGTDPDGEENEARHRGSHYYLGVALCLYGAIVGSVANVIGAQCNKRNISSSCLMLVSGSFSLVVSLTTSIFLTNRLISHPAELSLKAALLLPASAGLTMIAYWTITLAVSLTRHPTLISMLRSTEIIISQFTEAIWWQQLPGPLSLSGSLLVSACVLAMAAHDKIVSIAKNSWKKYKERRNQGSKENIYSVKL